jgi:gluconokinase
VIVVLIGVAGSGKTTVGELLAVRLKFPFLDADALHTPATVEQMACGEPLTDAQRDAWLDGVIAAVEGRDPLVLACSALRRRHRARLRAVGDVRMFLLDAPRSVLSRRLEHRSGHFFPAGLLDDQLATLERPLAEERITIVDADRPAEDVVDTVAAGIR